MHKKPTIAAVAEAFSNGSFQATFPYLDEHIVWTVVGENQFMGKQAVKANCLQVEKYFNSVTTKFERLNTIIDDHKIVVTGTAEFIKENKRVAFVAACDVYEFNKENKIVSIISYCIQHK